ncbi:MAG: hypothetical protein M3082_13085, partial [Candidatus Dormibacteraeota bacterium]|nr:hypothetical protein [Candidatus Dormibacteraeota bacterium]
ALSTAVGVSVTVTLADDGRTISLQTGQRVLVSLGDDFDWTVQVEGRSGGRTGRSRRSDAARVLDHLQSRPVELCPEGGVGCVAHRE